MKIEIGSGDDVSVPFDSVDVGACFRVDDTYYMKLGRISKPTPGIGRAAMLGSGDVALFQAAGLVIPVEAKVVIER